MYNYGSKERNNTTDSRGTNNKTAEIKTSKNEGAASFFLSHTSRPELVITLNVKSLPLNEGSITKCLTKKLFIRIYKSLIRNNSTE